MSGRGDLLVDGPEGDHAPKAVAADSGIPDTDLNDDKPNVPVVLERELKPLIDMLPQSMRGKAHEKVVAVGLKIEEQYSGDVPHPRHMERFEALLPGATDRFLTLAENHQEHRIWWERKVLINSAAFQYIGLIFGLIVSLSLIYGAIKCATLNQPAIGVALVAASAAGMVTSFITGQRMLSGRKTAQPKPDPDTTASEKRVLPSRKKSRSRKR